VAVVCFGIAAGAARAQTAATFTLDVAATAAQEASLTVAAPTTLSFKIVRSGGPVPPGFAIDVGTFKNAQDVSLAVSVSVDSDPDTGATHLEPAAFSKAVLPVNLHVKAFPAPGRYTGVLIITTPATPATPEVPAADGKPAVPAIPAVPAQSTIWRFNLTSAGEARPATLLIDQNALTLTGAKAWYFGSDDKLVATVHVRDKSGNWPLEGVMARLEQPGVKAPAEPIDWNSQVVAKFNGQPIDLFSPGTPARLAPHQQGTVTLEFRNLPPGEYTIPLQFASANSGEDDLQKLTLTLQVRDSLIPAILVLGLAALFSYFATRVVGTLRQRAEFLARVRALRPSLANQPDILPVIWVRATLRLAETLSGRILMTGRSELDARLKAAASVLSVLDRVRQVRRRIGAEIREEMVRNRAIWKLDDRIVSRLGAAPLTEQEVANFKAELDQLEGWCDPGKMEKAYWDDVLPVIQARCIEVKMALDPAEPAGNLAHELITRLEAALANATLDLNGKIAAEADYQRLSILWEAYSHQHGALADELVLLGKDAPLTDVRATIDNHWWDHLNEPDAGLEIKAATSSLDPQEAYEPVTFRIETPRTPFLLGTYLVRKKLTYQWTITIYTMRLGKAEKMGTLDVVSSEPQVAQYAPTRGQMHAEVKISYEGREGPGFGDSKVATEAAVPIKGSADFGIFAKYELSDLIAFGLAAAASIASGLALYVLKPTFFGSLQDYLALFTWGASLDQGKNFVQSLGAYAGASGGGASQNG
jgi:hypothetical protein